MLDSGEIKEFVSFQIHRHIVNLYKKYIVIAEDLHQEHQNFTHKVQDATSNTFVKNIDYFDEKKYNYVRKKILDAGNETIRDVEKIFDVLDVSLDSQKMDELRLSDLTKSLKIEGRLNEKDLKVKGKLI